MQHIQGGSATRAAAPIQRFPGENTDEIGFGNAVVRGWEIATAASDSRLEVLLLTGRQERRAAAQSGSQAHPREDNGRGPIERMGTNFRATLCDDWLSFPEALFAPAGTPPTVADALRSATVSVTKQPVIAADSVAAKRLIAKLNTKPQQWLTPAEGE